MSRSCGTARSPAAMSRSCSIQSHHHRQLRGRRLAEIQTDASPAPFLPFRLGRRCSIITRSLDAGSGHAVPSTAMLGRWPGAQSRKNPSGRARRRRDQPLVAGLLDPVRRIGETILRYRPASSRDARRDCRDEIPTRARSAVAVVGTWITKFLNMSGPPARSVYSGIVRIRSGGPNSQPAGQVGVCGRSARSPSSSPSSSHR